MKKFLSLAVIFAAGAAWAQTVFVPGTGGSAFMPLDGLVFTNALGNRFSVNNLAQALESMQTNLSAALPSVAAFNDSFDFVNIGLVSGVPATTPAPAGATISNNLAAGFGANVVLPPGATAGSGTVLPGTAGPTGFANLPLTRDSLRALLILQNHMEQMLGLLAELNGTSSNALAASSIVQSNALTPGSNPFTGAFFIAPAVTPPAPPLTPTGR
ncbi:MAG TPA: hypothetical protein VG146_01355 [Verrucomicrobiae bacterium]|nr:hypothetical protein [Verrucomicrobiae bacterium]